MIPQRKGADRDFHIFLWLIIFAIVLTVSTLTFADKAGSQEALPDENLLALSCDYAKFIGVANGFSAASCRRVSEAIEGNRAVETISLRINGGKRQTITITFMRSLWGSPVISAP
jgi:hypothetical protein